MMLKFFCILALVGMISASWHNLEEFMREPKMCPEYEAQKDLDFEKAAGDWYLLARNKFNMDELESQEQNQRCFKINFSLTKNETVEAQTSFVGPDDAVQKMPFTFDTKSKEPGSLFFEIDVEDQTWFGIKKRKEEIKSSLIYTDYDNIAVVFTCFVNHSHWIPKAEVSFDVLVRKRDFDSLAKFGMAASALARHDVDLNDIEFVYNGANCKN